MAPEGKGQWSQMDPGPQCQTSSFLGLGAILHPGSKGLGLVWLLEWASDTRTIEMKPSPLWGKG